MAADRHGKEDLANAFPDILTETKEILGKKYPSRRIVMENGYIVRLSAAEGNGLDAPSFFVQHETAQGLLNFGAFKCLKFISLDGLVQEGIEGRLVCYSAKGIDQLLGHMDWVSRQRSLNGECAAVDERDMTYKDFQKEMEVYVLATKQSRTPRPSTSRWMPFKL